MLTFYDFEVVEYNWLVVMINPITREKVKIWDDPERFRKYFEAHQGDIWIGYNNRRYDQYIAKGILLDMNPKKINDWIIVAGRDGWQYSTLFNKIQMINYDVMPNIPVSLKVLEGFMGHNVKETDVSFDIKRPLTEAEKRQMEKYCEHDVEETMEVWLQRKNEFDSQLELVKEFNLPLSYISKTQAQLAAIILGAERVETDDEWDIRLPETAIIKKYTHVCDWFLNKNNHNEKAKLTTTIAGVPHVVAWGGIHGAIPKFHYTCKPDEIMIMADVAQLYPNIMIIYNLLSRAVKEPQKLKDILDTSLRLKAEGKKKQREPYKRICNITYGAEGDPYNPMYDPLHRKLVCVFGQILLIDIIERCEGFAKLIQSNTDGVLFLIKRKDFDRFDDVVWEFEQRTGLCFEFEYFYRINQKDVNNYVAVPFGELYDKKGKPRWKCKGAYTKELSPIDNDLPIINKAVVDYLVHGVPVERTINSADKLIDFQKIVRLSSKYEYVEHNDTKYTYKCFRVFASKRRSDGTIYKCRDGQKPAKFGNTPRRCFIENGNITGLGVPPELDREWYIQTALDRLEQYGVITQ